MREGDAGFVRRVRRGFIRPSGDARSRNIVRHGKDVAARFVEEMMRAGGAQSPCGEVGS